MPLTAYEPPAQTIETPASLAAILEAIAIGDWGDSPALKATPAPARPARLAAVFDFTTKELVHEHF